MRLTIIKEDGFVSIDGVGYVDLDLSSIPENIHAVQWYGTQGEIEFKHEPMTPKPANEVITSIDQFQSAIDAWQAKDFEVKNPPPPPPPTQEELKQHIEVKTSMRLHEFARSRGYDSIVACISYLNSSNTKYAQEATYALSARDATWEKVYQILNEIETNVRPITTAYEDIESELPELVWPT